MTLLVIAPDPVRVELGVLPALATHCAAAGRTALWSAACSAWASTVFGEFAVDPVTGVQLGHGHSMAMVCWENGSPTPV